MNNTLSFEILSNILDEESFKKVIQFCSGYRVIFPKSKIENKLIIDDFKKLKKYKLKNRTIIKNLAQIYNKSERRIYEILKEEMNEFRENRKNSQ